MKTVALLHAFLFAAAPPGDADRKVPELVSALEDDSIERREKAAADLLELGEPALRALRTALETAPDSEARARIGDVLHRLHAGRRRREFQGGETTGGFRAAVRTVDSDPSTLQVQIEIMNVGEGSAAFFPVRLWNLQLPRQRFVSNLAEGLLEIRQLSGEPCGQPEQGRLCVPGPHRRSPVLLKPGESLLYEYRLDRGTLPKGEYSLRIEYSSSWLLRTEGNLTSNTLKFSVDR